MLSLAVRAAQGGEHLRVRLRVVRRMAARLDRTEERFPQLSSCGQVQLSSCRFPLRISMMQALHCRF
jgi:hypothetical protein